MINQLYPSSTRVPGSEGPGSESTAAARIDTVPSFVNGRRFSSVILTANFGVVSKIIDFGGDGRSFGSVNFAYSFMICDVSKFVPCFFFFLHSDLSRV